MGRIGKIILSAICAFFIFGIIYSLYFAFTWSGQIDSIENNIPKDNLSYYHARTQLNYISIGGTVIGLFSAFLLFMGLMVIIIGTTMYL